MAKAVDRFTSELASVFQLNLHQAKVSSPGYVARPVVDGNGVLGREKAGSWEREQWEIKRILLVLT